MSGRIALFLFPHQDDELAVYGEIERLISDDWIVYVAFLTRNRCNYLDHRRRCESSKVLSHLNVPSINTHYIGLDNKFFDGFLHESLEECYLAVGKVIGQFTEGAQLTVYSPAYEGGHPDHDAAFLVASALLAARLVSVHFSYYLYNDCRNIYPFFSIFTPIQSANVKIVGLSVASRFRYIFYITCYRSQWRTFIGLLPFICIHYLFKGYEVLSENQNFSGLNRPHPGHLYYEKRKFLSFALFSDKAKDFVSRFILL